MTLGLGRPIARGSRSTVHAWGADAVAKVPLADTPDRWIRCEADYCTAVHQAGAPVPEFLGFEEHAGRVVSIYRRANGVSMWDLLVDDPRRAEEHGRGLVELQVLLAGLVPPVVLPAQLDRLRSKIRIAAARVDPALDAARDEIPTGGPVALCHGDLHPGNVIVTVDGPMMIDWFDAARGDPVGDVARTAILLTGDDGAAHLAGATGDLLACVRTAYVDAAIQAFGVDACVLDQWRAVVAVARIAEGVPAGELRDVWQHWHDRARRPACTADV